MRMQQPVLLVGSIPAPDAETAMRRCAEGVGSEIACLPDGETGMRRVWINFLAAGVYAANEALETVSRPHAVDPAHAEEWRAAGDDWIPRGYDDHWLFRIRDAARLDFPTLGYAQAALDSYATFRRLKDEGTVPAHVRFMVCLPLAESGTRMFVQAAGDFGDFVAAYQAGLARDLATIASAIPAGELAIQWDICIETLAIECGDRHPAFPWRPAGDPFERYLSFLEHAAGLVPDEALMGLHLCYGDLGHRHLIEPPDLSVCVRMANAAPGVCGRPVDFYHVPVPRERTDDAYFVPLEKLGVDGKLYIGLLHHTDGVPGSIRRVATARRHARDFGIATECGFGRRPPETLGALLAIHREVAAAL